MPALSAVPHLFAARATDPAPLGLPVPSALQPALRLLRPRDVSRPHQQLAALLDSVSLTDVTRVDVLLHATDFDQVCLLTDEGWSTRVVQALCPELGGCEFRWRTPDRSTMSDASDWADAGPGLRLQVALPSEDLVTLVEAIDTPGPSERRRQWIGFSRSGAERDLVLALLTARGYLALPWTIEDPREPFPAWLALPTHRAIDAARWIAAMRVVQQLTPGGYPDTLLEAGTLTPDARFIRVRDGIQVCRSSGRVHCGSEVCSPITAMLEPEQLRCRPAPNAPLVERLAWSQSVLNLLEAAA